MKKITFISLLFILLFSSCTIEKMRYSRGYHIEWISKKHHTVAAKKIKEKHVKYLEETPQNNSENFFENVMETDTVYAISKTETPSIYSEKKPKPPKIISSKKPERKAEIKTKIQRRKFENFTKKNINYKSEKTQIVGILLFLISLIFLLLAIVFYTALGLFFGTIFLVIFLIVAGGFLIAAILSIFL